ncbi:hypothetical protein DUGA2_02740 [Duganella sp. HH101]|nr:hypothetical protein DUGA2_02740 [Duganella sp. HH101]
MRSNLDLKYRQIPSQVIKFQCNFINSSNLIKTTSIFITKVVYIIFSIVKATISLLSLDWYC